MKQGKRGGRREGAGRKPLSDEGAMSRHMIRLRPSDLEYLAALDAQLSRAIRKLIDQTRRLTGQEQGEQE